MPDEVPGLAPAVLDPERLQAAQRVTWVSVAVNIALTFAQVVVGFLANAQSLVADGLHSASDLLADFFVLLANRRGSHAADSDHPYGHRRVETAASLALGLLLAGTGAALLISAGARMQRVGELPPIGLIAFWVALATLAAKEILFRYMLRVAERLRSPMLVANAWHARADAASSLVVAAGIGGSLLGWRFLDLLAAAIVGFMILRMGWKFAYEAIQELIDTGLDTAEVAAITATLRETPGVVDLHELRTRRMAHNALVDAHIQVDGRISVSEGHRIAELARARVLAAHEDVLDVLVHVDAEADLAPGKRSAELPGRAEILEEVSRLLGPEVPRPERTLLHYLGGRVEAELFFPPATCPDAGRIAALQQDIATQVQKHAFLRRITLHCRLAPS